MLIGVLIHSQNLYVTALRDGGGGGGREPFWRCEAPFTDSSDLEIQLTTLLADIPRHPYNPFQRLLVHAAVGSPFANTKVIRGIPPIPNHAVGEKYLRDNASRYFVMSGSPKITTGIKIVDSETAVAGRIDADIVDAIRNACKAAGARSVKIAPSTDEVTNDPYAQAEYVAKSPANAQPRIPDLVPVVPTWRLALAGGAVLAAAIFVLIAPTLALKQQIKRDQARLAVLAPDRRDAVVAQRELGEMRGTIAEVQKFTGERTSTLLLLSQITRAIPPDAAVSTLRYDNGKVDLVVLAKRAAAAAGPLNGNIIGPVTREMVGTQELERATISFKVK